MSDNDWLKKANEESVEILRTRIHKMSVKMIEEARKRMKITDRMAPKWIDTLSPLVQQTYRETNKVHDEAFLRAIESGYEIVNVTYYDGTKDQTIIGTEYTWDAKHRHMKVRELINGRDHGYTVYHVSPEEENYIREHYARLFGGDKS